MSPATDDKTLRDTPESHRPAGAPRPYLIVVLECARPLVRPARYGLAEVDEVLLGRGSARAGARDGRRLAVRVPDRRMSVSHAEILRCGETWMLRDCGSTNGTRVNGERVTAVELRDGELIEVGRTLLRLWLGHPAPPGTLDDLDLSEAELQPPGCATILPALASGLSALALVARSTVPVMLQGESGTGKELLARAIHQNSGRPGDFVAVNCGAMPQSLVEGQLFGHVRGAFSGAVRDEPGLVRAADQGTLFLDEIGDLPAHSQAALLRVLQEGEVVPVGATRPVKLDLRVVSATHRDLDVLARRGEFRLDLLARLAGYRHVLPALRERREDLGLLVAELLQRGPESGSGSIVLDPEVGRALLLYDWPLNIRELQQCLALSTVLAEGGVVTRSCLPQAVAGALEQRPTATTPSDPPGPTEVSGERVSTFPPGSRVPALSVEDERVRSALVAALEAHGGNVSEVARAMGKARMQIQRWMKRFQLDAGQFRR